ncbi:Nuclear transport factor 2, eukaryote,NTF2-like domain [Cinara cedri]|uniref:Nuclear transport factor 2, eukaryote,NTF2-like domain n=1 Tax=Cinara cedri TaxID=506608 RepID=A0A5E4M324_9HEMI|nr:Nuclear transport factor 2, eukaryote,NTF2-like domain [Cinara cedri]
MGNRNGVVDATRERRAVAMAKLKSLPRTKYALNIGYEFTKLYYSMLRTTPEYANEFYDTHGKFRTVFEDGLTIVVSTRLQVKRILMRPLSACDYKDESIILIPCGSSGSLMVMVFGKRFTQSFLLEYRPKMKLGYAIVMSVTLYISKGPVTYNQTPPTTFVGGDRKVIKGAEKSIKTSILRKPVYSISAIINSVFDHAAIVTRRRVISSKLPPINEPDTATKMTPILKRAPKKTASENIEPKFGIDNKKVVKNIINLVLLSAACWAAYRYLK